MGDTLDRFAEFVGGADSDADKGQTEPSLAGRTIGRYRLLRKVGQGGMGVVYEAEDPQLKRRVAIKVLADVGEADLAQRLYREASIAARLTHPNIVTVHELGEHFIAMEFIDGRTLSQMLGEPRAKLVGLLEDVARAAGYAHEQGVVHRDIKPQNVLVDAAGRAYLGDFGLARDRAIASKLTGSNQILGTPHYMAPEQVMGRGVGPRTDVYALGVVLYEILAGRPPFTGDTPIELYQKIIMDDAPRPGLDAELEAICLKALDKRPARRYRDGTEFADDLARWRRGEPVQAKLPGLSSRVWRMVRRRARLLLAIASALALVVLAGTLIRQRRESDNVRQLSALMMQVMVAKEGLRIASNRPEDVRRGLEEAVAGATAFIEKNADHPQAFFVRARGRLLLDDLDGAERDLTRAIDLDSTFAPAHSMLGRVLLERYQVRLIGPDGRAAERARDALPLLKRAEKHLRAGASAELPIRWGLPKTPDDEVAHLISTVMLENFVQQDGDATVRRLEEAHERAPSEEVAYWLALCGRDAERWLDRALERMPLHAKALAARGVCRAERGDEAGAFKDLSRAIEVSPRLIQALLNRGILLAGRRAWTEALADLDRAIEIDPSSAMGYHNRGSARLMQGDHSGAERDLAKAIELDPEHAAAWVTRGNLARAQKNVDAALAHYERAFTLRPDFVAALHGRACARANKGDHERAEQDYARALERDPRSANLHYDRAVMRGALGDHARALAGYDRAIELNSKHAPALVNRANLRRASGDVAGAIDDLTRAIEAEPSAAAYTNRGEAHRTSGDLDAALADHEKAIELDPRLAAAHANRGVVYQDREDFDAALRDFGRAIELDPALPEPYVNRAMIAEELATRRPASARELIGGATKDLRRALEVAPAAWVHREKVQSMLKRLEQ